MAGRLIDQRIFRPHIHHYFVITVGYHNMTHHHYQLYHAEIHRRLATVSRRRITLDPISAGISPSDKLGEIGQIKLAGYAKTIHIADFFSYFESIFDLKIRTRVFVWGLSFLFLKSSRTSLFWSTVDRPQLSWLVSKLLRYKAGVLGWKQGIWKSRIARTSTSPGGLVRGLLSGDFKDQKFWSSSLKFWNQMLIHHGMQF